MGLFDNALSIAFKWSSSFSASARAFAASAAFGSKFPLVLPLELLLLVTLFGLLPLSLSFWLLPSIPFGPTPALPSSAPTTALPSSASTPLAFAKFSFAWSAFAYNLSKAALVAGSFARCGLFSIFFFHIIK